MNPVRCYGCIEIEPVAVKRDKEYENVDSSKRYLTG